MFEVGQEIDGHVICLKALVGSHNYDLNTPTSDKDYKYFVYPTFDDLYNNKTFHREVVSETEDYTIHDIRQLPILLWKSNLNFIEICFSKELSGLNDLDKYLYNHREALATTNPRHLYNAGIGMYMTKRKQMLSDSPARHSNIETYGYDGKSACHALRLLDFLNRYYETHSIENAFRYNSDDVDNLKSRNILLNLKANKLPLKQVECALDTNFEIVNMDDIKKFYHVEDDEYKPNKEPLSKLTDIIKRQIHNIIGTGLV